MSLPLTPPVLAQLLAAAADLLREGRLAVAALLSRLDSHRLAKPYETIWLELVLDLQDAQGEHAVLQRRQRIRFLVDGGALVRELVWGEGEQLVRYQARGAHKLAVRPEGSRRAVLLDPALRPAAGDRLTLTSRRTIRGGFRDTSEYCEVYLERPTGRVEVTVVFPANRPPKTAQLVQGATGALIRLVRVRYRADGRALVRCRLQTPATDTTYGLRWTW